MADSDSSRLNSPNNSPHNRRAPETGIIAWMARNPVAANLLMLVVMAAGVQALFGITKEVFPSFPGEALTITVPYPGSSPEEVEEGILIKVEESIQDIIGTKEIRSVAKEGSGVVTVELQAGADVGAAMNKVKVRVDGISSFPLDAEPPIIEEIYRRSRIFNLTIFGDLEEAQLKQLADEVRDEILALPGITQVDISGTRDYEISIEVSNLMLLQYGLQFDDVINAVRAQSRDLPGGKMRMDSGTISLRSSGQAYTAQEFSELVLVARGDGTRITIGDIATVRDAFEDQPLLSRLNGRAGITLQIDQVGNQDSLAMNEAVRDYTQAKQQTLPQGVQIAMWSDRTNILKSRMNLLLRSAAQGVLLVMLVLALFLEISLAFWVVAGLPFCILGALMMMNIPAVDISVNIISLFGFILVLGILVDDAIVTAESAYNQLEEEGDGLNSIIRGVKRVAVPTVFGVLTTILAFMPLILLQEGIGRLFSYAGPVIIFCLIFSLVETKLILPAHLRHIKVKGQSSDVPSKNSLVRGFSNLQQYLSRGMKSVAVNRYRPLLQRVVDRRYVSLASFVAVFILVVSLVPAGVLRLVFFPNVPADAMSVSLQMPQGSSYQQTHDYSLRIERAALAVNERYRKQMNVNSDVIAQLLVVSKEDTKATITAELVPSTERKVTSVELAGWWREGIGELAGVKALSIDANAGRNSIPVNVELQGADLEQLRQAAEEVNASLRQFDGVFDVRDTFDAGGPEVDIRITEEGKSLGLGQAELARQVRQAFFGAEIQRIQRGRHEVRVYVRFPVEQRESLQTLRSMWIQLADGRKVPFDVVGEMVESTGVSVINRIDRRRVVNVLADVDKAKVSPTDVLASIEKNALPDILKRYPSVTYRFSGEAEDQAENTSSLILGTEVMLIMIFAALAIPLKSYGKPLIIMSVIPFGIVGALLGHLIMGKDLSIISIIGIIALSGVVVNDSLVLMDYINQRVSEGVAWAQAVMDAGVRRFRAVILTSVTTFVGLLPIQLETSIQSQFLKPMAISVAFGVLFATVVTLLLVPVLCFIADDIKKLIVRARIFIGSRLLIGN